MVNYCRPTDPLSLRGTNQKSINPCDRLSSIDPWTSDIQINCADDPVFSCEDAAQQVLMSSVCPSVCGQPENIPFYILLEDPECSRMFQNVSECMQNVPECSRMFQNVPECMQKVPECSRMHAECSKMLQNAYRMF